MSSSTSSPKRIERVSSDNIVVGFDLLSSLTYMSVLSIGGLSRDRVLEYTSRQRFKTAVFFEYIYSLAKNMGFEYTHAFQLVSEKAKASNVKSLLLRFAASISSGESEREFIAEETRTESERYSNEYDRSVENLRKWTDAYAAILVSVTLIMVVSLVSSMMGSLGENFIVLMAFTLFFITSMGVYIIFKVAPVEATTFEAPLLNPTGSLSGWLLNREGLTHERHLARLLLLLVWPGILLALVVGTQLSLLAGFSFFFLLIGLSLLPAGYYAWKDDTNVTRLDSETPTFWRSVGNVAGSTGITLTEALKRIDTRSMGSLEPHIDRLQVRIAAQIPSHDCWEKFTEESGSELVHRTTRMMVDGVELGGPPADVGQICSHYAQNVTQLRAKRNLVGSTFSFLTVPMHATMVFILVFILEIIRNFNTQLAEAAGDAASQTTAATETVATTVQTAAGTITIPQPADLAGGLDIFGSQDMTMISYTIIFVIIVLTVANSFAPKLAAGGSNLKLSSFLSIMCIVSGVVLGIVPIITSRLFSIS